jgi:4-carboxymuconolactone decarboxylase
MNFRRLALAAGAALSILSVAVAQDRMPPIPPDQMTEAQKKAAQEIVAGPRGEVRGPYVPLLRSPELARRLQRTGEYLRFQGGLEGRQREMMILLAARHWTQQYEFSSHQALALKAGLKPNVITAIAEGRRPEGMAEDEEIIYSFSTELNGNRSVSDATYARAVKKFGEQRLIDLVCLNGYYSMMAMVMNVARTPLPAGAAPPLAAFPR